mgnify:CR=1 FL=1
MERKLNDHLELTDEEKLEKLKDSDKEINEDGVVVEKISFLAVGKQKDKESEMEWD